MGKRVFLIHWHQDEAEEHAAEIGSYGWDVVGVEAEDGERAYKKVKADAPDVVVVYLTRLPSHGRQTAKYMRQVKATRDVPLIFVGGEGEALRKTQDAVPDALYVDPQGLPAALEQAVPS